MNPRSFCPMRSLRWLACFTLVALLVACGEEPAIKIGYLGGLTGRTSGLGVSGRDAVLLAVEQRNQQGGINGRKIELLVKDDRQDEGAAKEAVKQLIDARVSAIVGPMTSSIAMVVKETVDRAGVVMISPTVKTDLLNGQDDMFLRVTVPCSLNASKLADYAVNQKGLRRFSVVYDTGNRAFTETWLKCFTSSLASQGGQVVAAYHYVSGSEVSFLELAKKVIADDTQGLLILSSAIDAALMAQQIRKLDSDLPMFTAEWAFTADVINFGGRAVEGLTSFHSFNADSQEQDYLEFKELFEQRFGYTPSFATVLAYDATLFLFAGLERSPSAVELKSTLTKIGRFKGLQSDFTLDEYGDVDRQLFLTTIQNGRFVVLK